MRKITDPMVKETCLMKKTKQGGTKRRTQKENPREKPQTRNGRL